MKSRIGLITGCGKGIGLEIIKQLIEKKENKLLIGITRSKSKDLYDLFRKYPKKLIIKMCDVSNTSRINEIIQEVYLNYGQIDFAICNAGLRSRSSLLDSEIDLFLNIFENNTLANINISKILIQKNLELKKKLNLLFISSIVGARGFKDLTTYAVSKSALDGFMKSAAVEYASKKIQINCIAPGFVESSYAENFKKNRKELYEWTISQTPMGRWGTCKEIADLAEFMVSEKNSFMTGSIVYCDGGWTSK
tara:strand:- start:1044 stop:1793 length:750 start_codon:yes stop_codon:yes gene_type:complete